MPQLLVRNVDDDVVRLLKQRAASHGRSAEAEHRAILDAALRGERAAFAARARRLVDELQRGARTDGAAQICADRDRDGIAR